MTETKKLLVAVAMLLALFLILAAWPEAKAADCSPGWCLQSEGDIGDDADDDGVPSAWDNCLEVKNSSQLDADRDGFGNICDADLDNSGTVTTTDYTLIQGKLSSKDPVADLNGSGTVTVADVTLLRNALNKPPGPAAPRLLTAGGFVYSNIMCIPSDCESGNYSAGAMVPYQLRSIPAGQPCWPYPPTSIPSGVGVVWGRPGMNSSDITLCRLQ